MTTMPSFPSSPFAPQPQPFPQVPPAVPQAPSTTPGAYVPSRGVAVTAAAWPLERYLEPSDASVEGEAGEG